MKEKCVFQGSHWYGHCSLKDNKVPKQTLQIKPFVFPLFPVFIGNGCVQYATTEYVGHKTLGYNIYFLVDHLKLSDAKNLVMEIVILLPIM